MSVVSVEHLGFPWRTWDPFLFCVHHNDNYPKGNELMGPAAPLSGRNLGQDFSYRDGWSMYHGRQIPGFPRHPHRGFETITLVRSGVIDHADSLGATARFGGGDCQWMTAGTGIEHAEMFPLRQRESDNPLELFQIWLNLPAKNKHVAPYFTMLWADGHPRFGFEDDQGRQTEVVVVAGRLGDARGAPPPPDSWASNPENSVNVWTIRMDPGAKWTIPASAPGLNRCLYFFEGPVLTLGGHTLPSSVVARLTSEDAVELVNGPETSELLLLEGRPINEPVAHHGPFVMNTNEEIRQAFVDYRAGKFGTWPWPDSAPVHAREKGRFAVHADGRVESRDDA